MAESREHGEAIMWVYVIFTVFVLHHDLWGSSGKGLFDHDGTPLDALRDVWRAQRVWEVSTAPSLVEQAQNNATRVGKPLCDAHNLALKSYKDIIDSFLNEKQNQQKLLIQLDVSIVEYEKLDLWAAEEAMKHWGEKAGPEMREISSNNLRIMRETRDNPRTLNVGPMPIWYMHPTLNQIISFPAFPALV